MLWMFQKAVKTAGDVPSQKVAKTDDTPKQKSRTPSAKQHQHADRGAAGDRRPEKSFDLSQSVFPPAPSSARHASAAAGSAGRDENKTVSWFHHLANYNVLPVVRVC